MMREVNKQVKRSIRKMNRQLKVRPIKIEQVAEIRQDIISDLWACNKKVVDGKWYIELSQAVEVIGGSNEQ